MSNTLVPLAQYLTYAQAVDLYNVLLEQEVVALVKSCGPPSLPYGAGIYYQLLVKPNDLPIAKTVFDLFSPNQQKNETTETLCPRCGSNKVNHAPSLSWWQKIIYSGTSVCQCQTCRRTFFT